VPIPPASISANIAYTAVRGPWGPIHLAAGSRGLVALEVLTPTEVFVGVLERRLRTVVVRAGDAPAGIRRALDAASVALEAFLDGGASAFDGLALDLGAAPDWDRRVLDAVRRIPWGAVTSYGRLARLIGAPGAARAVGGAVGRNPIGLAIPCHRIIAGDGSIGGYGGGWWGGRERLLEIKRELLAREGVVIPASEFVG
jgi:methylated-DNA-[protein]-cysteine S-methyltransferase